MFRKTACQLTTKDFNLLEVMLERATGFNDPIEPMLRRKLRDASIVFRDDVSPQVATLNSRVQFRVDDGDEETRVIVQNQLNNSLVGMTLPITTLRGLALLGLMQGQSITYDNHDGEPESIQLDTILFQPEAAQNGTRRRVADVSRPQAAPHAQILSFDAHRRANERKNFSVCSGPDDDDHGPGAA